MTQDRTKFIGGSDAKRIVDGDWLPLWMEKTGRRQPEDLSRVFRVQLGRATEGFHLDWLTQHHGFDIRMWEQTTHDKHDFIKVQVDGWCRNHHTFVEVKHTNARSTRDDMLASYLPQVAHACLCTGAEWGWLSFIAGNDAPDFFKVRPSRDYLDALLEAEVAFWWHVANDSPPDNMGLAAGAASARAAEAAKTTLIDEMRVVDMEFNNEWASHAALYLAYGDSAASFEAAKKALKAMVEPDVRIASGHGITISRARNGNLLFK